MEPMFYGFQANTFLTISAIAACTAAVACIPVALGFRHTKRGHAFGLLLFIAGLALLSMAFMIEETGLRRMVQSLSLVLVSSGAVFLSAMYFYLSKGKHNGR